MIPEHAQHVARHLHEGEMAQWRAFDVDRVYSYTMVELWCEQHDTAHTVLADDGEPVMIGGFDFAFPWIARCWSLSVAHWAARVLGITKMCREMIRRALYAPCVRRAEIFCLASRTDVHQWYERSLGFTREATLRGYGANGEDFALFSRLREDV